MNLQKIISDLGEGSNGKSFMVYVLRVLAGTYYSEVTMTMLTKDPPKPNECNPDLWSLRGVRIGATPEIETEQCIKASWMKRFSDPSCEWKAREPFARRSVVFSMRCCFNVCSNTKLEFSSKDGGVTRRCLGFSWPLKYVDANPKPDSKERPKDQTLDDENTLLPMLPALLYVMCKAHSVFHANGQSTLGILPMKVADATENLVQDELTDIIEDETSNVKYFTTCTYQNAMTVSQLMAVLKVNPVIKDLRPTPKTLQMALLKVFEQKNIMGRKNLARRRSDGAFLRDVAPTLASCS